MPSFSALPFKRLRQLFVLPPDWESWWNRINSRNFTTEQITKRLNEAKVSLAYAVQTPNLQFVVNGQLHRAVDEVEAFIMLDKAAAPIPEARACRGVARKA